jgi:hypothetical protein
MISFYLSFFLLVVHARSIYLLVLVILYCLHHQRLFLLLTVFLPCTLFFLFYLHHEWGLEHCLLPSAEWRIIGYYTFLSLNHHCTSRCTFSGSGG